MGVIIENPENADWRASGILGTALEYLKDMDVRDRFSATGDLFGPELMADSQIEYIRPATPAEVAEDYPEWNPNHEPKTPTT